MFPARSALLSVSLLATLFAARASYAQSCTADSECGHGFTCQVVGTSDCTAPACKPGDACATTPPCTPTTVSECVLAPCTQDADCQDGMVCATSTSTTCSGGVSGCAPNTNCPTPEPPTCTQETHGQCQPRWTLPCTMASDCGDGFNCVTSQQCACSGGGGSASTGGSSTSPSSASGAGGGTNASSAGLPQPEPASDAGAMTAVDAASNCTCEPISRCAAVPQACTGNSDCRSGWQCAMIAVPRSACKLNADGGVSCDTSSQDAAPPSGQCQPPSYRGVNAGSIESDKGSSTPHDPGADATPTPATDVAANADAGSSGPGLAGGGCQTSSQGPHSGATWLAAFALGLAAMLRRQHARRTSAVVAGHAGAR